MARTLRAALGTMVAASAAPYGYTVTTWSSGAVLMRSHGAPSVAEVFAFIAGALLGFAAIAILARGPVKSQDSLDDPVDRVAAGMLHWLAVGCAVGAAAMLAEIHGWEAWPLGAFAATSLYILAASLQLALVTARRGRAERDPD
jgi:hypothetical protein